MILEIPRERDFFMCKEIGVVGTGLHKKRAIESVVNPYDANFRMLRVDGDIPEVEHRNPKKILIPKLVDYLAVLEPTLPFLAWAEIAPHAVMAMDVVGLDMSNAKTVNDSFGNAREILKKPESGTAAHAVAKHFGEKAKSSPINDYVFDAFVAGAVIAPVDRRRGELIMDYMTTLWDNAVWMGCSMPLATLLADEHQLNELIADEVIGANTVNTASINGIRLQHLLRDLPAISDRYPGKDISMRVVYRNIDMKIAGNDDLGRLSHVTKLVDSNMANATPFLGRMIVETVNKFPI